MANVELFGKDDPTNEYRIFRTEPDERCGKCAFRGKRINAANFMCVHFDQPTNEFAGCNKFRKDKPMRREDSINTDVPWFYRR